MQQSEWQQPTYRQIFRDLGTSCLLMIAIISTAILWHVRLPTWSIHFTPSVVLLPISVLLVVLSVIRYVAEARKRPVFIFRINNVGGPTSIWIYLSTIAWAVLFALTRY